MKQKRKTYQYIEPIPSFFHTSIYNLEVRTSTIPDAGLGVFTNEDIIACEHIDFYTGDRMSFPISKYYFQIKDGNGIDAGSYPRCYMAMINDGFEKNNCKFTVKDKQVSVWSIRDIKKGEELFVSYGDEYWE
jgi:SET domain